MKIMKSIVTFCLAWFLIATSTEPQYDKAFFLKLKCPHRNLVESIVGLGSLLREGPFFSTQPNFSHLSSGEFVWLKEPEFSRKSAEREREKKKRKIERIRFENFFKTQRRFPTYPMVDLAPIRLKFGGHAPDLLSSLSNGQIFDWKCFDPHFISCWRKFDGEFGEFLGFFKCCFSCPRCLKKFILWELPASLYLNLWTKVCVSVL